MPALVTGASAPDFTLPTVGGERFSLKEALNRGPVVAAFFKISCPVCQFAFPFIERLYRAAVDRNVTIVGISQNDESGTRAFIKEYGLTFPIVLDDRSRYPVSNSYGLTNVPTMFLISPNNEIEQSIVGWDRKDMEELGRRISGEGGASPLQIFRPGEDVPAFKAG